MISEPFKVIARGEGPELVLLHGWGMHSGIWGGVVDALAAEFRVNLVDLPGHGVNRHIPLSGELGSVTDLMLSELPPAIWLGWSLGGLLALSAAIRQPSKVQKMILVAATPSFSQRPGWDFGVDFAMQRAFTDGLASDAEGALKQFCVNTFGVSWLDESLRRLGGALIINGVPTKATLSNGLDLLYGNNLLPDLNACKIPSLFLGGTRDRTVRQESLVQAASLMPNARSCIIPGAGHTPFISHEEKFLDIVRGFLRQS